MTRQTHSQARRSGTTVVETAVVSLVCLTFMFAIFEYGRYVMVRQVMENAARVGARMSVVMPTSYVSAAVATQQVNDAITHALASIPLSGTPTVTMFQADNSGNNIGPWTQTPFGRNIVVQIDGDLTVMFPTFGFLPNNSTTVPNAVHITVASMMRGEAN
jgi:Flp pilus assembly protein TadG